MAKAVYFVILFCGLVSIYGLPTNSDDDTKGCKRIDTSCMKKRYRKARKNSEKRRNIKHSAITITKDSEKGRKIKHSAISIAKEKMFDELRPVDNHIIDVYMTNKDYLNGDDAEHVYSTSLRVPALYHPLSDGVKRSNIIVPFQNFVVNDDKTMNKVLGVAKEAGEKRMNQDTTQALLDLEYQRQLKIQRQRELDMQHFQQMYMHHIHQLQQQKQPLYHVTPSALFVEYPRALYTPEFEYLHQYRNAPPSHMIREQSRNARHSHMNNRNELSETSALRPIINAYHTLLRTPIKDFVKALHMAKYDHES